MRDNPRSACAVIRIVKIVTEGENVIQKMTLRNSLEYNKRVGVVTSASEFHHLSMETLLS